MMEKQKEPDLIEKIAKGLPLETRAEFLNELRYMRSLPENDEMLRILRVMMFLTHLTEQVPMRILTEREKFEKTCNDAIVVAKGLEAAGSKYYQEISQRLIRLPDSIITGINPRAIVKLINENLKNQFDISTIPIVARELAVSAGRIKTAAQEYTQATGELCDSWHAASDKAHEAIRNINDAVSSAAKTADKAINAFSISLDKSYNRMQMVLTVLSLLAGAMSATAIIVHFFL